MRVEHFSRQYFSEALSWRVHAVLGEAKSPVAQSAPKRRILVAKSKEPMFWPSLQKLNFASYLISNMKTVLLVSGSTRT